VVSIQTVLARTHIFVLHIIIFHNIFKIYTGHNQSKPVPFVGNFFSLTTSLFLSGKSEEQEILLVWPYQLFNYLALQSYDFEYITETCI
jgi:hypothetical protein